MYLADLETMLISHLPVHDRPRTDHLEFSEKAFRGDSSFPSGHVIPYAAPRENLTHFQKWKRDHNFRLGLLRHRRGFGPVVNFTY